MAKYATKSYVDDSIGKLISTIEEEGNTTNARLQEEQETMMRDSGSVTIKL